MSLHQSQVRIVCKALVGALLFAFVAVPSSRLSAQEEAPQQTPAQEVAADEAPVEDAATAEAPAQEAQASTSADVGWPSPWVTAITSLAGDEQFAATSQGLLLREAAVVRTSVNQPQLSTPLYTHPSSVWAIAANDQFVCSSDYRGNLGVWSRQENTVRMAEGVLERWTRALAFSPDPDQLVAVNEAGKFFVWSLSQGVVLRSVQLEPQQATRCVFSPKGDQVAVVNGASQLQLLAWPSLEIQQTVKIGEQPLLALAYSGDAESLVVGGADRKLWRVQFSGEPQVTEVAVVSDWISSIDPLSSGGGWIAGGMDGKVYELSPSGSPEVVATVPSGIWDLKVVTGDVVLLGTRKHAVSTLKRSWILGYAEEPAVVPVAVPSP